MAEVSCFDWPTALLGPWLLVYGRCGTPVLARRLTERIARRGFGTTLRKSTTSSQREDSDLHIYYQYHHHY
uniref:Uncharacterized protein n=1 Tax=Oryza glumipatula TaxID=40148 RepID=A0A0E0BJV7_9ORYZ